MALLLVERQGQHIVLPQNNLPIRPMLADQRGQPALRFDLVLGRESGPRAGPEMCRGVDQTRLVHAEMLDHPLVHEFPGVAFELLLPGVGCPSDYPMRLVA